MENKQKLDNLNLKILFELDKNSRVPVTTLAKKLRVSREILKYRIKRLVDSGVIKSFISIINPARFGYIIYKVYLKLENTNEKNLTGLESYLMKHKKIFWLAECGGSFDLVFGVYIETIPKFNDFLLEFSEKFNEIILERHISSSVYSEIYRKTYLSGGNAEMAFWGGEIAEEKVDNLSKNILKKIAENSRKPIAEISEELGAAPQTIISKIRKMEKSKVILGYRTILDLEKLKKENFKALIYFKGVKNEREKEFKQFCKNESAVQYYIKTIGEWDAELDVEIESFHEFNTLIRKIKKEFVDLIRKIDFVYLSKESKGELNIVQNL